MENERDRRMRCESSIQSGHIRAVDIQVLVFLSLFRCSMLSEYRHTLGSSQINRILQRSSVEYRIRPTAAPCFLSVLRVPQHPRRDAAPTQGHLLESTEACRRSVQTIARGRGGSIFYFEPIFNKLLISYIYNIGCYLLRK